MGLSTGTAARKRTADVVGVVVAEKLRNAHVGDLGGVPRLAEQNVGRLDVAVDDLQGS